MRPFDGIRVLDLTHVLAGPFCTHQLAMLGADVIKIEAPDRPDMTREEGVLPEMNAALYGTYFQAQAAGKRSITLDLANPEGAGVMRQLIASADVLVQNYAGDALARLGFGPEESHAINPRLIYCQMTGYGRTGPKAGHPAYDVVIQAFSGIMAANGGPGAEPVRVGPPMVDYGTGAQAALAISAALYQRDRTGRGQVIDVAMADAAFLLMSAFVTDAIQTGEPPHPHGNLHPAYAGYATYDTADGVLMIGAWTNEQLARLFETLGEDRLAAEVRATPRAEIVARRDADRAVIAQHMLRASAAEWEERLNRAHVPAARVRSVAEALNEPQVAARRAIQPSGTKDGDGPSRLPVAAYTYAHGGPGIDRPPPRLGEHTEAVLSELGYDAAKIAALREGRVI